MVNIMYFKNKVMAERAAAESAAARDAFVQEQELIRQFAASYLQPGPPGEAARIEQQV